MNEKPPFYITTPIYYVNDSPHLGHAYTTIACDVMARFMRLDGCDVKFTTGTDEHGQKVDKAAKMAGRDPQEFTDEVSERFRSLVSGGDNLLNVTNDDFVRTTEKRHKKAAQELWGRLVDSKNIYKDRYGGWYAVRDEAYYQESELIEKDGKKVAPSGAEVEWVEEESYFFRLSDWQDKLLEFYENNPSFIVPKSRYNEVVSFVKGGLKDLSISRTTFDWGVPVPGDEGHVMYVWIDALTNYLTSTGFPDEEAHEYKKFWCERSDVSPVHVVGKDIIRFHAVYWPAFLMAANLPLPSKVVAHGWWTIEGEKMSKSIGNVISPQDLIANYGLDQARYFLMRAIPFGNDGDFSRQHLIDTVNADLANNIGNLAQRTLSMIQKNCGGKVPEFNSPRAEDEAMLDLVYVTVDKEQEKSARINNLVSGFRCDSIIGDILTIASSANEYIDKQEPWKLKKENPERMGEVLFVLAEVVRCIGIMLQPFCPNAAKKLLDQLVIPESERMFEHLTSEFSIKSDEHLPMPTGVFPRIDDSEGRKEAS